MTRRDPLLRAAQKLAELLGPCARSNTPAAHPSRDLSTLLDHCAAIERLRRLQSQAHARGWHHAAQRLWPNISDQVQGIRQIAGNVLTRSVHPLPQSPTVRSLLEDLRQLAEEFEEMEIDLKAGSIIVHTPAIELEDVQLGPFAIELHLSRLPSRQDASCFDCVALKANPASSNSSVTHPHVQDRQLCAGDAGAPLSAALRQGRICDAFCLVRSVLQTYNESSPYVALDSWEGVTCSDCGYTTSRENTSWCEHCDHDCCDECMSCCESCDGSCCRGCLERDEQAETDLCPSCRTECSECGRVVDRDDIQRHTGMCPQCREKQQEDVASGDESHVEPEDPSHASNEPTAIANPPGAITPGCPTAGSTLST